MISSRDYRSDEVFRDELRLLFGGAYQFVCMTTEVANNRDFVCLDYPGTSIVVQNFKGELAAFENVCRHRFSRIQTDDRGNRPLMCRYHGWNYGADGCPFGIPRRSEYQIDGREDALCLPRYRVEACGKFVFVAPFDLTVSLRDYLGTFYDALEKISQHFGPELHYGVVPHRANWKILVENVVDNLHCGLLHQDTFIAWGYCRKPLEDIQLDGPHSSFHVPRTEQEREGPRRRALSHLQDRGFAHDSFYHAFIFPNLFVASTEGYSFYVGHAIPVSPGETQLRVRYYEPAVSLEGGRRARQDLINEQTRVQALKIIEEDRPILEQVQKGMEVADGEGFVADSEVRIHAFFEAYRRSISAGAVATPELRQPPGAAAA